jgi:hypothetical protein
MKFFISFQGQLFYKLDCTYSSDTELWRINHQMSNMNIIRSTVQTLARRPYRQAGILQSTSLLQSVSKHVNPSNSRGKRLLVISTLKKTVYAAKKEIFITVLNWALCLKTYGEWRYSSTSTLSGDYWSVLRSGYLIPGDRCSILKGPRLDQYYVTWRQISWCSYKSNLPPNFIPNLRVYNIKFVVI